MKMRMVLALLVLAWLCGPVAHADMPGTSEGIVKSTPAVVTTLGVPLTVNATTGKVAKAAGSSATTVDAWRVYRTQGDLSVYSTITATQTVSCTLTFQGSWDGTNFAAFNPAVTVVRTANGSRIDPITVPVVPFLRCTLGSDATYPITWTAVVLNSW